MTRDTCKDCRYWQDGPSAEDQLKHNIGQPLVVHAILFNSRRCCIDPQVQYRESEWFSCARGLRKDEK